jgi:zona occludens toxin
MSILAYVGLPGSGKSYDVVANQILPALKAGRRVVTNIPLHEDLIRADIATGEIADFPMDQVASDPGSIEQYATPGCVLVLDELWKLFPAGQKVNQVPDPFKHLLAEHRHMVDVSGNSMQIVFVSQDLAQIGMFARQLVEQTYYHTKLSHLGMRGTYRIDIYHGSKSGQNPPRSDRLRDILGRYDSKVYRYYKSHTMSESGKSGANEVAVDGRANIWRKPGIYVAALAVIVFALWGGKTAYAFFHQPGTHGAQPGASGATAPAAPLAASSMFSVPHVASGEAVAVVSWRVSAVVDMPKMPGGGQAWLTNGRWTVVVPFSECRVSPFDVECPYGGVFWSRHGVQAGASVGAAGPVLPVLEPALTKR